MLTFQEAEKYKNKIAVEERHTVGLREDGTVVAVGNNEEGQCNVSSFGSLFSQQARDFRTDFSFKAGTTTMRKKFCSHCGAKVEVEGALFCWECGNRL